MKREQIMKIFRDYSVTHGDLMSVADAILTLPLDVPTIEEANIEANKYGEIDKPDYGVKENASLDFVRGTVWMRDEIIKRNK